MPVIDRCTLSLLAALYGVAIVYMAWIPFNLAPIGLVEAWGRFLATPWFVHGSDQQADWAANLGMLVPFGYLLTGALRPETRRAGAVAAVSFLISVALILVAKFSQLYFPPRTVSLNYILAQSIGSLAGIAAWFAMHRKIEQAVASIRTAGPRALETILMGYVPLLAFVTLQPFNFTFTAADLTDRLAALPSQLFELPGFDRSPLHGFALLGVSAVLLAPLGALVELRRPRHYGGIKRALALGIVVSVAMELAQVVIIDGSTRMVSIPVRAPGVVFGMLAFRALRHAQPQRVRRRLRWLATLAAPVYLVALLAFNELLSTRWQSLNAGLADFDYRYFIPFFGHYFVPKAHAVVSLLTHAVMYMPIGLSLWAWKEAGGPGGARQAAISTFALAMVLEWARFFKPGLYPDFSNGIIGAISAGMTVVAADYVWRALYTRHVVQVGVLAATPPPATAPPRPVAVPVAVEIRRPGLTSCIVGLVFLAAAAAVIDVYPIGRITFALVLAAYAVLLWWHPHLWLVIVPAVVPSLWLAPWTGSIYLEESDAVLLITLGMLCLRMPLRREKFDFDRWTMFALLLLGLSTAIALAIGAAQLTFANATIPADYFSPWNAARVAKGFAAATALLPFLNHSFRSRADAFRLFASGMVTGLTLVGLAVLLERALFPGVFDFASDYRVAGPFASMHVGGAHLPAYLVLALPFTAVMVVVPQRRALVGAVALGVLCLGVYAMIVTFNRTAYAAAGLTLVILFAGLFYAVRADPHWRRVTAAVAITVGSAAVTVVGIALLSPIMRERFATTEADTAVRLDDWRSGLSLRNRSLTTSIFGMGLGSFPRNYLFAAGDNERPATFSLRTRDGQSFLRLGAGTASYLGQKVDVRPDLTYELKVSLRTNDNEAALLVLLCEKYLIYSVNCVEKTLRPAASSTWVETGAQLDSGEIGQPRIAALPWLRRPAELVLVNARPGTILEVARLQLLDPNTHDVVVNGDFTAGLTRWYFSNDNHLAWRIKSMWVMTLFEQGWFGLLALVALLGATFRHLIEAMRTGDRAAPIVFAALIGFCAMGLTDGLIEVPRLTALFYLVMFAGLCLGRGARADARTARPQTDVSVRPERPDRPVPTRHPPSKTAVRP